MSQDQQGLLVPWMEGQDAWEDMEVDLRNIQLIWCGFGLYQT